MRDDPLPQVAEATRLLLQAAHRGASDPELARILRELEQVLPVLRGQEWGVAVQRQQRGKEP